MRFGILMVTLSVAYFERKYSILQAIFGYFWRSNPIEYFSTQTPILRVSLDCNFWKILSAPALYWAFVFIAIKTSMMLYLYMNNKDLNGNLSLILNLIGVTIGISGFYWSFWSDVEFGPNWFQKRWMFMLVIFRTPKERLRNVKSDFWNKRSIF